MSDRCAARPRPVADAPVQALLAAAPELAKRWLLALIASVDLQEASRMPIAELARDAPLLVAGVARGLASDAELDRLRRGGDAFELAARAGALGGARDPAEAVRSVDALRAVMWDSVLDELRDASPAQVAELAARLSHVVAQVTAAAASATAPAGATAVPTAAPAAPSGAAADQEPLGPAPAGAASDAVIPFVTPTIPGPRPAVGDVPDEGPGAWIGSIGRRLERFAEDRLPFAVLLIEVADVERLAHALDATELGSLVAAVERVLSGELRPADVLTREAPGRYWLVTPDTDREGARMLAERLARAVRGAVHHRGVGLGVAIGTSVCPEDGQDAAALAARADVGVYAARAAGRAVPPADAP